METAVMTNVKGIYYKWNKLVFCGVNKRRQGYEVTRPLSSMDVL